jgi:putative tryptophan/tyrosine transport system substrate-binding protein
LRVGARETRMAAITRRELAGAIGGAVTLLPLAVRAQRSAVPMVGLLYNIKETAFPSDRLSAFRRGLNETGFAEGRNVAIESRFAGGHRDRLPALAADLVSRGAAAIVVSGVSLSAAMAATSTTPIVFIGGIDPVTQGLVNSLNRPGGNVTGISFARPALGAKRLELLHELLPKPTVVAVLLDPNGPAFRGQLQSVGTAARTLGRQIVIVTAANEGEFDTALTKSLQAAAGALYVGGSEFFASQRRKLIMFAADHALPASYEGREFVEAGGLMSYGASAIDAYRRGGTYVGRILKGTKPSDLPIELPTNYDLVINLSTAKALGLDLPPSITARASEFIE